MKSKTFIFIIIIILLAGLITFSVAYNLVPKYSIYLSQDGTLIYRFNKISGRFESHTYISGWSEVKDFASPIQLVK